MLNIFKNVIFLLYIIVLTACTDNKSDEVLKGVDNFKIETKDISNILKTKGFKDVSSRQEERLVATYEERNAIAYIVVSDDLINLPLVRAEIKRSRNEIIIKNYFDEYVKKETSDVAIKQYYDNHIDEFTDKKAHVAHILIKSTLDRDKNAEAESHKKALKIADQLRRKANFEDMAKQYSEDMTSNSKGGDLGWIEPGSTDPIIIEKVMSLSIGEIPQPILTAQGYHIVKLIEPIEKKVIPFDKVKSKITYKIEYEAKLKELKRLKKLAKNEVNSLN